MFRDVRRSYPIYLFFIITTLAVYWRVTGFQFINYDDHTYITQNSHIKHGLNSDSIAWAFTKHYDSNWMPITWISFMIDHQLSGPRSASSGAENPSAYHRTNLVLHVLNVLLLFIVLNAATGFRWRSAFVSAVFALHPLHVESVAWVAERKDVLSTFFLMLTILAYLHYTRRPSFRRYLLVTLAFILGLMSKPMLVTLPLILLLLDFWPLKRITKASNHDTKADDHVTLSLSKGLPSPSPIGEGRGEVLPSLHSPFRIPYSALPLLLLSAAVGIITLVHQSHAGAVSSLREYPIGVRLANASISSVAYIRKMVWPAKLAFFYPHPHDTLPAWQVAVSCVLLILLTALAIRAARRYPYITVGWFWYLITLLPVIGIVQVGDQAMADRYTYTSLIGIFIVVAWGVPDLLQRLMGNRFAARLAAALAGVSLLLLAGNAYRQVGYWRDDETLFRHAIAVTERNAEALHGLGGALTRQGRYSEAAGCYKTAVRYFPNDTEAHYQLALAFDRLGKMREAMHEYRETLRCDPDNWPAAGNLAETLATDLDRGLRNPAEAIRWAEAACRLTKYSRPEVLDTLAIAYAAAGDYDRAASTEKRALKLAVDSHQPTLVPILRANLRRFEAHSPQ